MYIPTNQIFIPTNSSYLYSGPGSPISSALSSTMSSPLSSPSSVSYIPFNYNVANSGLKKNELGATEFVYSPGPNSVITTNTLYTNPFNPIVSTVNYTYNKPSFGLFQDIATFNIPFQGLNADPLSINKITEYFYKLTLDKWLYEDLSDILNYFTIDSAGNPDLIKSFNDYKSDNSKNFTKKDKKKIIEFIETYFLTLSVTRRTLDKYVKESGSSWVSLPHTKFYIRQLIGEKIMKLIRSALNTINKK